MAKERGEILTKGGLHVRGASPHTEGRHRYGVGLIRLPLSVSVSTCKVVGAFATTK